MTTIDHRRPSFEIIGPASMAPIAIPAFAVPEPAESQVDGMEYFPVFSFFLP